MFPVVELLVVHILNDSMGSLLRLLKEVCHVESRGTVLIVEPEKEGESVLKHLGLLLVVIILRLNIVVS